MKKKGKDDVVDKKIAELILAAPVPMSARDAAYALGLEHAEDLVQAWMRGAEPDDLLDRIERLRRLAERAK